MSGYQAGDGFEPLPDDGIIINPQYISSSNEIHIGKALVDHHGLDDTEAIVRLTNQDGVSVTGGQYIDPRGRFTVGSRWRDALDVGPEDHVKLEVIDAFRDNPDSSGGSE